MRAGMRPWIETSGTGKRSSACREAARQVTGTVRKSSKASLLVCEKWDDFFHRRRAAPFDQNDVFRSGFAAQCRRAGGVVVVRTDRFCISPRIDESPRNQKGFARPGSEQRIDPVAEYRASQGKVSFVTVRSQFRHASQYRDAAAFAGKSRKSFERGGGRIRTRVVGVVND